MIQIMPALAISLAILVAALAGYFLGVRDCDKRYRWRIRKLLNEIDFLEGRTSEVKNENQT